ncbi:uncharacterized protein LOC111305625 [Durio zibethinus]|uniref:Uncharacterized protein LOC111305625 n=1 Tax=Durio zibethinus TaxID=66656 RepID=A0A6P6A2T2_DURZI|nr:uncharacterized protein LOC111305625 [Durio zibethinus]
MAVEIPKDLITQLQISLRKQANVPSYDPNDSSLPTLPSLPHSISDSPNRCLHCKAHLLRGSDSLLCIFCGKSQTNSEASPRPIKFKSTSGYRWFLHSLNLDGSEMVGESLEGNESNRGSREEFPLSDLLDLEIRWNDAELEKFESVLRRNNQLNLAGLDLDEEFLAERKGDSVSVPSQGTLAVNKESDSTGSNAIESRENLSLFENFQRSKSSGSVSGWQADFQAADSKTDHNAISSQSFDPFVGSSKDLSLHMDTVLVQGKILFHGKEEGNQTSSESRTNDWFQDDMQSNSSSGVRTEKENIPSSGNLDWIQGDQVQNNASNAPGKRTTDDDDDDDSFDAWNDFKGSTCAQDAAHGSSDHTANGTKSMNEKGGNSFSGLGVGSESTVLEIQHEVSKSFDRFAGSSADLSTHMDSVFGTGKAVGNTTSSHASNWLQDDLWSNSTSGILQHLEQSDANVGDKDGGMLRDLSNYSMSINRIQDDQWQTTSNKEADNGTNDEDDDSFGAWNDFKSSSVVHSSISSWKEPAIHANSMEEKSSDPFSGWDTDFQSANSKNHHDGSKSSDPLVGSSIDLFDHMDAVFASGKDLVDGKAKDGSSASNANSWFQDDRWSNSTSNLTRQAENFDTAVMNSGADQTVHNSSSMKVDWFPDDQWLTGNKKAPDRKTVDESDNSFGDWNDFKTSTTMQDAFSNSWKEVAIPDNKTIDYNDDLSAAWNDFTSSTSAKDPSSISFEQAVHHEKPSVGTSETHLFTMDRNSYNNNFGSLSEPDFFSGAFSSQSVSTEINIMLPEAPDSDRMADANVRGGNNAEVAKDGDFSSATTALTTDDLEILMSQMHDLSFMLESNLSIPPIQK